MKLLRSIFGNFPELHEQPNRLKPFVSDARGTKTLFIPSQTGSANSNNARCDTGHPRAQSTRTPVMTSLRPKPQVAVSGTDPMLDT